MLRPTDFGKTSKAALAEAAIMAAAAAWFMWYAASVGGEEVWVAFGAGFFATMALIAVGAARHLAYEARKSEQGGGGNDHA
jgi:hypothetical protein